MKEAASGSQTPLPSSLSVSGMRIYLRHRTGFLQSGCTLCGQRGQEDVKIKSFVYKWPREEDMDQVKLGMESTCLDGK